MAIQQGDIKLVKSAVMDDVPEGGGGPTANEVIDGSSNAIFPDISETDRAAGRVSARKVHVWVQSHDTDAYLGAHAIVAEAPNDPNVSVTLFHTDDLFDTRTAAVSRLEAYLSVGANYAGYLFGNHIAGQKTLSIIQRTPVLPDIGGALGLTKREGFGDQYVQYVRVSEADVVLTTFTDSQGDFQRYVLTVKLTDPLRVDFPGFDPSRVDPTKVQLAAATKVSEVITADAARYYGVVKTQIAAALGDFTVKGTSIFSQLVPSAQIETPIADAQSNQLFAGIVSGGAAVVMSVTLAFTSTQNLFIGGAIKPNTLSIVNGGVVLTDSGGRLMNAGTQVGTVDYENGILSLLSNVFGTGALTYAVTYQPAQAPLAVSQSQGFEVTIANRSISYVRTIEPPPVPGTLSIAYMVASRWYVVRDDGSGAIRGADSSYGAGTVNPTTGTVTMTLGALPDEGSEIIYQWVEPVAARNADQLTLDNNGAFYWPFNTSGVAAATPGAKSITPGALSITWLDGGITRTVTDNGAGALQGYGTGTVNYAAGYFKLTPTTVPAKGTTINVAANSVAKTAATIVIASGTGNFGVTGITPGTVQFTVAAQLKGNYLGLGVNNWGGARLVSITDNGAGVLQARIGDGLVNVGTINYGAGTFTLSSSTVVPNALALALVAWDNVFVRVNKPQWSMAVA